LYGGHCEEEPFDGSEPEEIAIWIGGGEDARFEIVIAVEVDGEAFRVWSDIVG
jgi:hypothetical protein